MPVIVLLIDLTINKQIKVEHSGLFLPLPTEGSREIQYDNFICTQYLIKYSYLTS